MKPCLQSPESENCAIFIKSSQPSAFSNSELGCRSRSSGTDASPSDRGNLPELKLGAQDSLSRPLNPCVMGFSP